MLRLTTNSSLGRRLGAGAVALAALVSASAPAAAQSNTKNDKTWGEPPKVPAPDKNKVSYAQFGLAILLAGGIMVVTLIPSKRGHQD